MTRTELNPVEKRRGLEADDMQKSKVDTFSGDSVTVVILEKEQCFSLEKQHVEILLTATMERIPDATLDKVTDSAKATLNITAVDGVFYKKASVA